jgi:hypothetical protein
MYIKAQTFLSRAQALASTRRRCDETACERGPPGGPAETQAPPSTSPSSVACSTEIEKFRQTNPTLRCDLASVRIRWPHRHDLAEQAQPAATQERGAHGGWPPDLPVSVGIRSWSHRGRQHARDSVRVHPQRQRGGRARHPGQPIAQARTRRAAPGEPGAAFACAVLRPASHPAKPPASPATRARRGIGAPCR